MNLLFPIEVARILRATVIKGELVSFKVDTTIPVFGLEQRADGAYLHAVSQEFQDHHKEEYERLRDEAYNDFERQLTQEFERDLPDPNTNPDRPNPKKKRWHVRFDGNLRNYYPKPDVLRCALPTLLNDANYQNLRIAAHTTLSTIINNIGHIAFFGPGIETIGPGPTAEEQRATLCSTYDPISLSKAIDKFWTRKLFTDLDYQRDLIKLYTVTLMHNL